MSDDTAVHDLERALLERAHKLAEEYLERANATRERIIKEENERLRLREEREILAAGATAERLYHRRVQANELKLQAELDNLRWQLVVEVRRAMMQRLAGLCEEQAFYHDTLRSYLRQALAAMPKGELVVQLNARDHQQLSASWEAFLGDIASTHTLTLSDQHHSGSGGLVVYSSNAKMKFDNTFEGRAERLDEPLNQAIIERLFARAGNMEMFWHG